MVWFGVEYPWVQGGEQWWDGQGDGVPGIRKQESTIIRRRGRIFSLNGLYVKFGVCHQPSMIDKKCPLKSLYI